MVDSLNAFGQDQAFKFDEAMETVESSRTCVPIIMPWSPTRTRLDFIVMCLVVFNTIYAPLKVVYYRMETPLRYGLDSMAYLLDIMYTVFTLSFFFTAYVDRKSSKVVARPSKIMR